MRVTSCCSTPSRVFAEPVILTEEAHDEFVEAADQRLGTDQAAVGDDAHPRNGEAPAGWGMK